MADAEQQEQRLRQAREAYQTWQAGWNAWVKDQRERQKTRLVHNLEDAALDMMESGASVRQIARVYGTHERRTINRLLERAAQRRYEDDDTTPARLG